VGVVTSLGRILRLSLLDVPALPPTDEPPSLGGGVPIGEVVGLQRGEEALALVPLGGSVAVALGTAQGVVKRLAPEEAPGRDAWEVIALKPGDTVIGAAVAPDDAELVFVSSDAQLLRYSASLVRPQGRSAGGMAGISLAPGSRVLFFGAVLLGEAGVGAVLLDGASSGRGSASAPDPVVLTIAGPSGALPGTTPGTAKITPLGEFPAKGRATGGVRAHKFLKGEDVLLAAWAGAAPPRAVSGGGQSVDLPSEHGKRDGTGTPLKAPVTGIG
jgi:DNA gyrase subunit A